MPILKATLLAIYFLLLYMALLASSDPVVRYFRYTPASWPDTAPRLRLVLLSDTHVSGPDTPPARLERVVAMVNRLGPDVVMLAGDFISTKNLATRHYSLVEAVRPFAGFRATHGVIAVLGNHDHWANAAVTRRELRRAGVTLLDNDAIRIGPLAIAGVDDDFTRRADLAAMTARLKTLGGTPLLVTHSPDVFPRTSDWIGLTLAGHTHCGQILLPWFGAIATASRYGDRYRCGVIRDGARALIVTAGIGTSIMPLRLGAPPEFWVIDVGR